MNIYPTYSRNELIADGMVHGVGIVFGIVALTVLITLSSLFETSGTTIALAIYGVAMVLMFSCSAAYNLIPFAHWKDNLRRLDQSAIFLKIAGTYTPFALLKMGGVLGIGLLSTVWIVALLGVGIILALGRKHRNWVIMLYLALGWAGVVLLWPLMMSMSALAFGLLGAGGLLYTVGVIFHMWDSLPFSNVIWHIFVLLATMCHYFAVFVAVIVDV